jgi:hypothetical protein
MEHWSWVIIAVLVMVELRWLVSEINMAAYNRNRELLEALDKIHTTISAGFFGPKS